MKHPRASYTSQPPAIHKAAVTLGHVGGLKGGPARAKALPPAKRQSIAKKGAKARWHPL